MEIYTKNISLKGNLWNWGSDFGNRIILLSGHDAFNGYSTSAKKIKKIAPGQMHYIVKFAKDTSHPFGIKENALPVNDNDVTFWVDWDAVQNYQHILRLWKYPAGTVGNEVFKTLVKTWGSPLKVTDIPETSGTEKFLGWDLETSWRCYYDGENYWYGDDDGIVNQIDANNKISNYTARDYQAGRKGVRDWYAKIDMPTEIVKFSVRSDGTDGFIPLLDVDTIKSKYPFANPILEGSAPAGNYDGIEIDIKKQTNYNFSDFPILSESYLNKGYIFEGWIKANSFYNTFNDGSYIPSPTGVQGLLILNYTGELDLPKFFTKPDGTISDLPSKDGIFYLDWYNSNRNYYAVFSYNPDKNKSEYTRVVFKPDLSNSNNKSFPNDVYTYITEKVGSGIADSCICPNEIIVKPSQISSNGYSIELASKITKYRAYIKCGPGIYFEGWKDENGNKIQELTITSNDKGKTIILYPYFSFNNNYHVIDNYIEKPCYYYYYAEDYIDSSEQQYDEYRIINNLNNIVVQFDEDKNLGMPPGEGGMTNESTYKVVT